MIRVQCVVCFLGVLMHPVLGIVNFCAQNTFATNNTWLQLNKEASSYEYALEKTFKGLHCCAKGYRSIEWYKDGKSYPWPGGISNLILYPESANQTIYTQTVSGSDTGNYTCLLRNDTHMHAHTIHLHVFDKIPDAPKVTYKPKSQEVELGQSVRLFCEAFVGRVALPDAQNDVTWRRPEENATIEDQPRIHQEKIDREEGLTIGAYLVIEKITKEDYGEYICRISKPDKYIDMLVNIVEQVRVDHLQPNPVPWRKIAIISFVIILLILTTVVLNMRFGLVLRVKIKDYFGTLEDSDDKVNDVLICYSQKDAEFVLGVLIPKLETKYFYKCGSREFSSNVNYWHVEMAEAARKSRRILAILSPGTFNENWDNTILYQSLKQLQALNSSSLHPPTCITLKPLPFATPQIKNAAGETLRSLIQNGSVRIVEFSASDERFWLEVQLGLPPKRSSSRNGGENSVGKSTTRLTRNSSESLEILV